MDEFPRDNALGSFEDLLQRLEDLDHDSPREPFGGMAFEVSPTQYLTLLQAEPRGDPDTSDYSCGVVVFCLDVFYACGLDGASKTASALDRSALSMWIRDKNGGIQTERWHPDGHGLGAFVRRGRKHRHLRLGFASWAHSTRRIHPHSVLQEACETQLAADINAAQKAMKPRKPKAKGPSGEIGRLKEELRKSYRRWTNCAMIWSSSWPRRTGSCGARTV
ncbi:predicted protein [Chaetomium globosum CBS 148.51]|uniref:Uncharacterized protein n=1 Tax=Chaetomium globosum (strain ATCC 6205 / CBS 148.51 / DSM 1962 / NBRC 6347 / NRRL 1970) TaxID=306901 RepID=Q2GYH2_CHAGB|nr:uncharacterized protein CHGG_06982 [Chaetomium globosum CBS 148.51]EAQ85729.1 predicted protein [Chaetomium globosum CBS 148.51]